MKINIISNSLKASLISSMCAGLVVFAHFLTFAPLSHAQNILQPSPIDGLRFDTPIPDNYTKKNFSLSFLTAYDMKSSDLLTIRKSMPTPLTVTSTTTSSSIFDLIAPTVQANEASPSSPLITEESTMSAELVSLEQDVDELITIPSPTTKATLLPTATKKPEVTSSPTPKATSIPTVSPSHTPVSTATPLPTTSPTPEPSVSSGGLSSDRIFELVNNYRSSKGLPAVQKDERACEVARSRAPEVGAEISGGYMHRGIRQRNLSYFNSEIIISMRSEEAAVNWWIGDRIHREQMEGSYTYSCAACSGNSCVQEFTNFVPKG